MGKRLLFVVLLLCFSCTLARVTFDKAEVLDHSDLSDGKNKAPFDCPSGCRVYTPTAKTLKIINEKDEDVITFAALQSRDPSNPLELPAGQYFVTNTVDSSPDFTLYVVQKGADNYNTRVYTTPQRLDSSNQRFVTILADVAGIRISGLGGDAKYTKPVVYATGFDSAGKCKPVYTARSLDNARNTSLVVFGPIATVDFGFDTGSHLVTIGFDYLTRPSTALGSSTVLVSPGYVGCPNGQVFTNIYINAVNQAPYTITYAPGLALKVSADYSIEHGTNPVLVSIDNDHIQLSGKNTMVRNYRSDKFTVSVYWSRSANDYLSNFAVQIDNLAFGAPTF